MRQLDNMFSRLAVMNITLSVAHIAYYLITSNTAALGLWAFWAAFIIYLYFDPDLRIKIMTRAARFVQRFRY